MVNIMLVLPYFSAIIASLSCIQCINSLLSVLSHRSGFVKAFHYLRHKQKAKMKGYWLPQSWNTQGHHAFLEHLLFQEVFQARTGILFRPPARNIGLQSTIMKMKRFNKCCFDLILEAPLAISIVQTHLHLFNC